MAVFLDTNILLYAISTKAEEAAKQHAADALLERRDCILSFQVIQEFYVQATRPSRADALTPAQARRAVGSFLRYPVVDGTTALFLEALTVQAETGFSYWDCAIIAAAATSGCDHLYTDDMQGDRVVRGVKIVNPFV